MSEAIKYPKRLIEVDLPIKRISAHARREKSIRHGHISTLHIWWARRPLASCRAVILAALWPDPGDEGCPDKFRKEARRWILRWASEFPTKVGAETAPRLIRIRDDAKLLDDPMAVRQGLLDFIADFANWDLSNDKDFLAMSRALVQCAHECLGGAPGTRPLVIDPFAGGGAIPLEALRVGADAFASDLNPIAVLLNKVVLEYIPKYGQRLGDEVRKWGEWIGSEARKDLGDVYPTDPGESSIAWLWARTIRCEGPDCGAELPLIRSLSLSQKSGRPRALRILPNVNTKTLAFEIVAGPDAAGTVRKGSATCPLCKFTTPNARVRAQLGERRGGAMDARLLAVVAVRNAEAGRSYRLPNARDLEAVERARLRLAHLEPHNGISAVPDEVIPSERPSPNARGLSAVTRIGARHFGDLFAPRQALTLATFARLIRSVGEKIERAPGDEGIAEAVQAVLGLALSRLVDRTCSLSRWRPQADQEKIESVFGRQALAITWDFAEGTPFSEGTASWADALESPLRLIELNARTFSRDGSATQTTATAHPLPDDAAQALVTDPPYYDSVPYADLSDFFYVWLQRALAGSLPSLFETRLTPKDDEAIWNPGRLLPSGRPKDTEFYENAIAQALSEARRVVAPTGFGIVVFAHKSTRGWEAVLSALVEAGWITTASWPIDTEMGTRVNARGTASLASSIHLCCRPRENPDGTLRTDSVGDWREILAELPIRIHEWMPRLMQEGIVGADAIFACLGPALEIFSRHSRVEKASGEKVALKEYLEHVWASVAKEALVAIFAGAETAEFEEDARLTAMWLWTIKGGEVIVGSASDPNEEDDETESEGVSSSGDKSAKGFTLEYDAARKIAQGLGAHLEALESLIEVKGANARLLSVGERAAALFGQSEPALGATAKSRKKKTQLSLGFLEEVEAAEERSGGPGGKLLAKVAATVLDRVHQAMILFGAGRGEALRRFLVDDGAGKDERFWRLAQALNQLYPTGTDERRWVEGVLARKKGLGL